MRRVSTLAGLTDHLIDDAAVYPPGNAPLAEALGAHRGYRDSPLEPLVGPLLLPASSIATVLDLVEVADDLAIGVVADHGLGSLVQARDLLADQRWLRPVQYELRLPAEHLVRAVELTLDALEFTALTFLELPGSPELVDALDVVSDDGVEAVKFRCGPQPADVPDARQLATFLHGCAVRRLPFKLTAGLHRALPHTDAATGAHQHGFLNTLAATASALDGGSVQDAVSLLSTSNTGPLLEALSAASVPSLRSVYRSLGSCSISEPFADLSELGLVVPEPGGVS
ncbi:MAG: hypothetical protein WAN48_04780 [Actinomycetes bacterium]